MGKNKHMTLEDRITIQAELDKGSSFNEIIKRMSAKKSNQKQTDVRKEKLLDNLLFIWYDNAGDRRGTYCETDIII